jgi:hypothetical protein
MQCKAVNALCCGDGMWEWNWDDAGLVFLVFELGSTKLIQHHVIHNLRSLWLQQQHSFSHAQAQLHIGALYSCLFWPAHINAQGLLSSS